MDAPRDKDKIIRVIRRGKFLNCYL
jgi:hypothetical protein